MTIGYAVSLIFAVGLLIAYFLMVKNREFWLGLLYVCVSVVNLGYLLLSLAKTVPFAIFANDLAYLGSVFLSTCMLFTIMRLCGFRLRRVHVIVSVVLAAVMFSIVATSGFLPIYYESVSLETVNGASKLEKEYGILHPLYTVYLLGYFCAMIITILHSIRRKKLGSHKQAALIAGVVCGNLIVWIFEKFIDWEFEFLSVTYIISELILLLLYWMMQDYIHIKDIPPPTVEERSTVVSVESIPGEEKVGLLISMLPEDKNLTAKETEILRDLLEGKSRKDIAAMHHVSENTVKTHVTHIYEKFKVSGRDALTALICQALQKSEQETK